MGAIRRIRRLVKDFRGRTPIRHGHVYTDTITGERFEITTVGRWVEIERFDAERRTENSVRKGVMRGAIKDGVVEHDPSTCPTCGNNDV